MILAELRAKGWKYATIACAVLAVAAAFAAVLFHGSASRSDARADTQAARADALAAQVESLQEAQHRDEVSDEATEAARDSAQDRAVSDDQRRERVEKYASERPPVPDGCPDPDARIVQESADQAARIRAAEDRLRCVGRSDCRKAR